MKDDPIRSLAASDTSDGLPVPRRSSAPPAAGLIWTIPAHLGAQRCPTRSPASRRLSPASVMLPVAGRFQSGVTCPAKPLETCRQLDQIAEVTYPPLNGGIGDRRDSGSG